MRRAFHSVDHLKEIVRWLEELQISTGREWVWFPLGNKFSADTEDLQVREGDYLIRIEVFPTDWSSEYATDAEYYRENKWTSVFHSLWKGGGISAKGPTPVQAFINLYLHVQENEPELVEDLLAEGSHVS